MIKTLLCNGFGLQWCDDNNKGDDDEQHTGNLTPFC